MGRSFLLCLAGAISLAGCVTYPTRDYINDPIVYQPMPTGGVYGAPQQDQYQTIAINTPSGIVYKRCKVLNGQIVHCL